MFLKRLNPEDEYDVQLGAKLFCSFPEYMQATFGQALGEADGRRFVTDVPVGCAPEDILVFACFDKTTPVGVVQLQRHFMRPELCNIGLLLVDKAHQRRHLGCAIVERLSRQARNWPGIERFCIMVLQNNPAALAFWRHTGFQTVAENVVEAGVKTRVTIMERAIKSKQTCLPKAQATAATDLFQGAMGSRFPKTSRT
jgi:N-acetylglutamate synthase-like GNAT family acetyltransferase